MVHPDYLQRAGRDADTSRVTSPQQHRDVDLDHLVRPKRYERDHPARIKHRKDMRPAAARTSAGAVEQELKIAVVG